ncbi:hypothetical protein MSG28_006073 [Choristoneura fumiferana]|uniref:Uncharacterized protein n=1 Tax=Choristoneura fumiferana TaxID=7141 RepID=A0ACC0JDJ0_CHOFU|nr:hypothetical protein MSG28_006073 [Choristoneura fumiferana]
MSLDLVSISRRADSGDIRRLDWAGPPREVNTHQKLFVFNINILIKGAERMKHSKKEQYNVFIQMAGTRIISTRREFSAYLGNHQSRVLRENASVSRACAPISVAREKRDVIYVRARLPRISYSSHRDARVAAHCVMRRLKKWLVFARFSSDN